MNQLYQFMESALESTPTRLVRYLYDRLPWESRMFGIIGPRGVGKTTLMLQRIKLTRSNSTSQKETLYVSADNMYFAEHSLLGLADRFSKVGGKRIFIDEIHKYPNWSRELKNIYDGYPDLSVCFTGSSILDIAKGEADLSRRAPLYELRGLSYREYLNVFHEIECPTFSFEQVISNEARIPGVKHPIEYFSDYLIRGYYPFGGEEGFPIMLDQVITNTLEVDIPQFASMSVATGRKLKKLMAAVSASAPFKPNFVKLASQIGTSRNSLDEYLTYMEKAGLIARLRNKDAFGALGKVEKAYLDNTNIIYNLADDGANIGSVRETFFFNQVRATEKVVSSPVSDFEVGGLTFEIGGKNKTSEQVADVEDSYIVKDDIEVGNANVLPLWAFGLMY